MSHAPEQLIPDEDEQPDGLLGNALISWLCAALDVGDSTYRSWRNADPKRTPLPVTQEGVLARLEKLQPHLTRRSATPRRKPHE